MSGKISGLVWEYSLEKSEQLVLLCMADHADHIGENVFPSVSLVAWKTHISERQVHRVIKSLKTKGFLQVTQVALHKPVKYRIIFPNSARKPAYESPHSYAKKMSKIGMTSNDIPTDKNRSDILPPVGMTDNGIPNPENRYDISTTLGMTQLCHGRYDIAMADKPSVNPNKEPSVTKNPSGGATPTEPQKPKDGSGTKRKQKPKTKPTPKPDASGKFACALIGAFVLAFKEAFSTKYTPTGVDARTARELFKTHLPVEEIMNLCKAGWARRDEYEFKNYLTLDYLGRHFNELVINLRDSKGEKRGESPASKQRRISEQMKLAQEDYDELRSKWDYHVTLTQEELLRFNSLKSKLKELRSELTGIK